MIRCKSKSYAYLHHIIHYNQLSSLLFNQLAENLLKLNIKILAVVYSKSLHTALTVNQHKTFSSPLIHSLSKHILHVEIKVLMPDVGKSLC